MNTIKKKNISKSRITDWLWGYSMILPLMAGLSVFYFYPFFKVIIDSFFNVGAFNRKTFAGLLNYQKMLTDSDMWASMGNTFLYVIIIVPLTVFLAMILAAMLNTKIKGLSLFRVIYFIPTITMAAAIAMVWRWIFNGDYGILNYIITSLHGTSRYWLSDQSTALLCVSIVSIWMGVGYNMIILLAGIQGISKSYYEAAELDGASKISQFFNITLPLISPTLFFIMITTIISTFQTFDVIYMMIPAKTTAMSYTQSVVMYFYRNAFEFSKKGYASSIAVLLFVIIMIITLVQMKMQKKWVNYD